MTARTLRTWADPTTGDLWVCTKQACTHNMLAQGKCDDCATPNVGETVGELYDRISGLPQDDPEVNED